MSSIVIEAEFVEVGKHQKVVTEIRTMNSEDALNWFRGWKYCEVFNILEAKRIRNNLRSFGWYIVKSKGGYKLMEEIDLFEAGKSGLRCAISFQSITEDIDEPYEDRIIRDCGFHIVWVPSLQKRLVMRSVA